MIEIKTHNWLCKRLSKSYGIKCKKVSDKKVETQCLPTDKVLITSAAVVNNLAVQELASWSLEHMERQSI